MVSTQTTRWTYSICLAVMLAGGFAAGVAHAEFNFKRYRPYSLGQAIADHSHGERADWVIEAGSFKYRVRVTYTGEQREIKASVKDLISKWVKSLGLNPKLLTLFKHEILVREGSGQYWLPIQEQLLPHVARELRVGGPVDLYVMHVGSTKTELVFIVNEFQARRVTK
ncbi:MAG: hypothetical protein ACE5K9_02780 [Candidatus Methylomirabilales bacterium]